MHTHLYIERERKGGDIERVKDTHAHGHAHTHTQNIPMKMSCFISDWVYKNSK